MGAEIPGGLLAPAAYGSSSATVDSRQSIQHHHRAHSSGALFSLGDLTVHWVLYPRSAFHIQNDFTNCVPRR